MWIHGVGWTGPVRLGMAGWSGQAWASGAALVGVYWAGVNCARMGWAG